MGEEDKIELHRGLRDVYIDRTKSSFIDGKKGKLLYRGYNIHDLAEKSTFEECVYLLLYGILPTASINPLNTPISKYNQFSPSR